MAKVAGEAIRILREKLSSPTGLPFFLIEAAGSRQQAAVNLTPQQVIAQNVAPEVAEKTAGVKYPAVYVFCERATNSQREKFCIFSGQVRCAVEIRVSKDRLEGLEDELQMYVEAVSTFLEANRGDWGSGLFYSGNYDIGFGSVKAGGKHLLQTAKVSFDVDAAIE
jgi:hypothetical protein